MKRLVAALLVLSMCVGFGTAGISARTMAANADPPAPGDAAADVANLLKSAEGGNARDMFRLAVRYDDGDGVPQDRAAAARWYRKAAEAGHPSAMRSLGIMYQLGEGGLRKDA